MSNKVTGDMPSIESLDTSVNYDHLISVLHRFVEISGWKTGLANFYTSDVCTHNYKALSKLDQAIHKGPLWKVLLPNRFDTDILLFDSSLGSIALELAASYRTVLVWEDTLEKRMVTRLRIEEANIDNIVVLDENSLKLLRGMSIGTIVSVMSPSCSEKGVKELSRSQIVEILYDSGTISEYLSVLEISEKHPVLSRLFPGRFFRANSGGGLTNRISNTISLEAVGGRFFQCHGVATNIQRINLGDLRIKSTLFRWRHPKQFLKDILRKQDFSCPIEISHTDFPDNIESWLDAFIAKLKSEEGFSSQVAVTECYAGNPNIGLLRVNGKRQDCIFRLPMGIEENRERAAKNYEILQILHNFPRLEGLVPRPVANGICCGQSYFGESFLPGSQLILTEGNLQEVWEQIGPLQISFAHEFGRKTVISEKVFQNLLGKELKKIKTNLSNDCDLDSLNILESILRKFLLNIEMQLVLLHGDFKIENMHFDGNRRLHGIFDWDLGKRFGFPLIDLYYFFGYSFYHRTEYPYSGSIDFITEGLLGGKLSKNIIRKLEHYAAALELTKDFLIISPALFWIHYIAMISNIAFARKDSYLLERNFRKPLALILDRLL